MDEGEDQIEDDDIEEREPVTFISDVGTAPKVIIYKFQ
jgi:hypothetical protein